MPHNHYLLGDCSTILKLIALQQYREAPTSGVQSCPQRALARSVVGMRTFLIYQEVSRKVAFQVILVALKDGENNQTGNRMPVRLAIGTRRTERRDKDQKSMTRPYRLLYNL